MHYAWIIIIFGCLAQTVAIPFGRMAFTVIVPGMRDGLALSFGQMGLMGTGNFMGYVILALIGGLIAVHFGRRKTIFVGLLVTSLAMIGTGFANSFAVAFILRLITGLGSGAVAMSAMTLSAAWFVPGKRGLGVGLIMTGSNIGFALVGPMLNPILTSTALGADGWRYSWYLLGAIGIVVAVLCYIFIRDTPAEKGTTIWGGGEEEPAPPAAPAVSIGSMFAPWKTVVKEKQVWVMGSLYFFYGFAYIIYMTFLVAFITEDLGHQQTLAVTVFTVVGTMSIIAGILWGWFSDIVGRKLAMVLLNLLLAVSYAIFAYSPTTAGLFISAVIYGLCMVGVPTVMASMAGDVKGANLAPAVLGIVTLVLGIGNCVGPAVAGYLKDIQGNFTGSFLMCMVLSVVASALALILQAKKRDVIETAPTSTLK